MCTKIVCVVQNWKVYNISRFSALFKTLGLILYLYKSYNASVRLYCRTGNITSYNIDETAMVFKETYAISVSHRFTKSQGIFT